MSNALGVNPLFQSDAQGARRRSYVAKDQWGRPWAVTIENKTGHVTGIPRTVRWSDPIATPSKFVNLDPSDPTRVIVDYDAWIAELEYAEKEWQRRYEAEGFARYGEKFDPEGEPTPFLLTRIGPRPYPKEIVQKAAAGDEEYLGVKPEPRPEDQVAELQSRIAELEKREAEREKADLKEKLTKPLVNREKKE